MTGSGGSQVKDDPALAGLSAKDITKRVMPFVQFRMKEAQRAGKQVRGWHMIDPAAHGTSGRRPARTPCMFEMLLWDKTSVCLGHATALDHIDVELKAQVS